MTLTTVWLLAILPFLGLPNSVGSVVVSDTTGVSVQGKLHGEQRTSALETFPQLQLELQRKHWTFLSLYGPRLVLADLTGPERPTLLVLHQGGAKLAYEGRHTVVMLGQSFSVGEQYLANLTPLSVRDPIMPVDPGNSRVTLLAPTQSVHVLSETTRLQVLQNWSARWSSGHGASLAITGGADAAARMVLPRQAVLQLSSSLSYAMSARSSLKTAVDTARVRTSVDNAYWISSFLEGWSMQWQRYTSTSVGVGAAWIVSQSGSSSSSSAQSSLAPNLTASMSHELPRRNVNAVFRAGMSLAPSINLLTGQQQTALQGTASANLRLSRTVLGVSIDGLQTIPADDVNATRLAGVGANAGQQLVSWLAAYVSARMQHQLVTESTLSLPWLWSVTAGLAARPPTLNF